MKMFVLHAYIKLLIMIERTLKKKKIKLKKILITVIKILRVLITSKKVF